MTWDSDSSHPELSEKLREELRNVLDPEIGLNIIQMGLVRNVTISTEEAIIMMLLTTPYCPYGPTMLNNTKNHSEKILEIPVKVELLMEQWDISMVEDGIDLGWGLYQ